MTPTYAQMLAAAVVAMVPAHAWAQVEDNVACGHASSGSAHDGVVASCVLGFVVLAAMWWRKRRMDLGTSIVAFVLGMEMGEWLLRAVHSLAPQFAPDEAAGDAQRRWSVMIAFIFVALIVSHLWERSAKPETKVTS